MSGKGGEKKKLRAPPPGGYRAGGRVLSVLVAPVNALIVQELADGPLRIGDLRERVGCPAQTTLRGHLDDLIALGVIAKVEFRTMPYAVSLELTPAGQEMLFVVDVLGDWLAGAPQGELEFGSDAAKAAVKALAVGWGSAILRALAETPRSLTELDEIITDMSYPSLERRLSTMRINGQIEPAPSRKGQGTPYIPTDWVRHAIAPLSAAGRWERMHLARETEPVTWVEVEAAFLLTLPLVKLPKSVEGECVLAVDTKEAENRIAGVHLTVEKGAIVSYEAELGAERPPTFALGPAEAWLDAVIEGRVNGMRVDGDERLIEQLIVDGLHSTLFG